MWLVDKVNIFTHRVDSAHKELGSPPKLGAPDLPETKKIYQLTTNSNVC